MSEGKARQLRGRLSIDPDAPDPAPHTPDPAPPASVASTDDRSESPTGADTDRPAGLTETARAGLGAAVHTSALDDPGIVSGRNGYRSFYVADPIFARFRAAVHWTSRRQDAAGRAPENMSAAVEAFMDRVASELERDFNDGEVFPPTPDQVRKARRRQ